VCIQGSMTPACKRTDTCSWGTSVAGVDEATGSFDSTVTDFDYLTSPGAQAERNPEYQQALQLAQHICSGVPGQVNAVKTGIGYPVGVAPVTMVPIQQPVPVLTLASSSAIPRIVSQRQPGPHGALHQNQLRALELEAYANQLMAQAMQAKVTLLKMQKESGSYACADAEIKPDDCTSNKAQISLSTSVPTPESLPVVNTVAETERTTIMLRNLPNDYTRDMVLGLLDEHGFASCYNFVYVPMDNKRRLGLGYAFVNLSKPADAHRAFDVLAGFAEWKVPGSIKVLEVAWGNPLQGFDAHVERYRNSPIMHPDVPDAFKPVVFDKGVRIEFPAPTQPLKAPRSR